MKTLYPTKPLALWQKAKEIRLQHYRNIMTAKEQGKLLFTGERGAPAVLMAGFGDFEFLGTNDYSASMAFSPGFTLPALETVEALGYGRDLCGYWRAYMGSLLQNQFYFGGPFPKPDFVFTQVACDTNGKCFQIISEYLDIPYVPLDVPMAITDERHHPPHHVDHMASEFNDAIDRVSRLSGREFNDELLIEAIYNRCQNEVLWARIMMLNQAIPAPLDLKSQFTIFVPLLVARYKAETVQFYEELLEEMQDRVDQGMAAVATERCRLLHDGVPPWFALRFFRLPQTYGAVFVGSHYSISMFGAFDEGPDSSFQPKKSPREQGIELRNREEALRFFARWFLDLELVGQGNRLEQRINTLISLVRGWHIDGIVFHQDRGCERDSSLLLEAKQGIAQANGLPTLLYEGNRVDVREWAESEAVDRLESFLESLGLTKLEG